MPKAAAVRPFEKDNPPRFSKLKIHPKHDEGCPVQDPKSAHDNRCKCERSAIFNPGYRILNTHKRSAQAAIDWANQWLKDNDPNKAVEAFTKKPILEAIADCIRAFKLEKKLDPGTVTKMNTVYNSVETYITEWNAVHGVTHQLTYIHELTEDRLKGVVRIWDRNMPEKIAHTPECNRGSSCNCKVIKQEMSRNEKRNRIGFLVRVFERVIKQGWMESNGRVAVKNRQGKTVVVNESNPAAQLEVTGAAPVAKQKAAISDRLFDRYIFELEAYCAQRECKHTDPNLFVRASTYFRFLKRVAFAKTDGYTCRKDAMKHDQFGWYVVIERLKTGEEASVRISDSFHNELMNVPQGMKPTHPDFIFWSGFDEDKARAAANEAVKADPELLWENAYADALNVQQVHAADTMEKLWATLTRRILSTEDGRKLMYEECNTDKKTGLLITPTIHCFRYAYNGNFRNMSRELGHGDGKEGAAKSLGHSKAIAEEHYQRETPKEKAERIAIQMRLAELEDEREASAIQQFVEVSLKQ